MAKHLEDKALKKDSLEIIQHIQNQSWNKIIEKLLSASHENKLFDLLSFIPPSYRSLMYNKLLQIVPSGKDPMALSKDYVELLTALKHHDVFLFSRFPLTQSEEASLLGQESISNPFNDELVASVYLLEKIEKNEPLEGNEMALLLISSYENPAMMGVLFFADKKRSKNVTKSLGLAGISFEVVRQYMSHNKTYLPLYDLIQKTFLLEKTLQQLALTLGSQFSETANRWLHELKKESLGPIEKVDIKTFGMFLTKKTIPNIPDEILSLSPEDKQLISDLILERGRHLLGKQEPLPTELQKWFKNTLGKE